MQVSGLINHSKVQVELDLLLGNSCPDPSVGLWAISSGFLGEENEQDSSLKCTLGFMASVTGAGLQLADSKLYQLEIILSLS